MKNQNGFVTAEFMFAIIIATCMTILTFALTFTLSTVEIVQYMVFSASRAHAAANFDVDSQQKAARDKYNSLIGNKTFAPLFQNGWFEAPASKLEIRSGNGVNFEQEYSPTSRPAAQGVRVTFKANLLELKLPLVGDVTSPSGNGFEAKVNALLIREISQKECLEYMDQRVDSLWNLSPGIQRFRYQSSYVTPWEDNGC
jgi:hypothetical protein